MKYVVFLNDKHPKNINNGAIPASLGKVLKENAINASFLKIDTFINYNAGKLAPSLSKEIYVLADGTETLADIGMCERMCDVVLTRKNVFSSGKVLSDAITRERTVDFNGAELMVNETFSEGFDTLLDEATAAKLKNLKGKEMKHDVMIVMIDINFESNSHSLALEALINKMSSKESSEVVWVLHTQASEKGPSKDLSRKIQDIKNQGVKISHLITECGKAITPKDKNALVKKMGGKAEDFIQLQPHMEMLECLKEVQGTNLTKSICQALGLKTPTKTNVFLEKKLTGKKLTVGLISRYNMSDHAYLSLVEALEESARKAGHPIEIILLNPQKHKDSLKNQIQKCDGIVCPGGFGSTAYVEKLEFVRFARENKVPFLGICLGLQLICIEFCRNVLGIKDATSEEFDTKGTFVINKLPNIQYKNTNVYLGNYNVDVDEKLISIFGAKNKEYKFRHGYAADVKFLAKYEAKGLKCVGYSDLRIACLKVEDHPFMLGVQFHPELSSTPENVENIFSALIATMAKK